MEVSQRSLPRTRLRYDDTDKSKKARFQRPKTIRVHLRGLSQRREIVRDEARLDVS